MHHYELGYAKPEIVIGLAGPIGTDLRSVASKLSGTLRAFRYESDIIRVSDLLKLRCSPTVQEQIDALPEEDRIDVLAIIYFTSRGQIR